MVFYSTPGITFYILSSFFKSLVMHKKPSFLTSCRTMVFFWTRNSGLFAVRCLSIALKTKKEAKKFYILSNSYKTVTKKCLDRITCKNVVVTECCNLLLETVRYCDIIKCKAFFFTIQLVPSTRSIPLPFTLRTHHALYVFAPYVFVRIYTYIIVSV